MKIIELNEILDSTEEYLASLMKKENFKYYPAKEGLTTYGENLELGFSTFAIKILKMINKKNIEKKLPLTFFRFMRFIT